MRPYSIDLREKIIQAYDRGDGSLRQIAREFGVAKSTLQSYLSRRRDTGSVAPAPHGGGRARLLGPLHLAVLLALREFENDRTDAEYAAWLERMTGQHVSRRTLNKTWQRLGITRKKKVLHASEQDRPDVRRKRAAFLRQRRRQRRRRHIYLDEFGFHLGMTRSYARAPRGVRALGKVPQKTDPTVTLTAALSPDGIEASLAFKGGTDGRAYQAYMETQLGPKLRPGDVVIADQLAAHHSGAIAAIVRRHGAHYVLLPPYSPDFNPVEEAGSKVKNAIRAAKPRTLDDLYGALGTALNAVTPADARGWFADRASYLSDRAARDGPPL